MVPRLRQREGLGAFYVHIFGCDRVRNILQRVVAHLIQLHIIHRLLHDRHGALAERRRPAGRSIRAVLRARLLALRAQ